MSGDRSAGCRSGAEPPSIVLFQFTDCRRPEVHVALRVVSSLAARIRAEVTLRQIIGITIGGCLGLVAFYIAAAYVACEWLWPPSSLCGLAAVVVAPIGAAIGAIAASRLIGATKPT